MVPEAFEREKKDALSGWDALWEFDFKKGEGLFLSNPDGSIIIKPSHGAGERLSLTAAASVGGIELGSYPDLEIRVSGTGPEDRVTLGVFVRTDDGGLYRVDVLDEAHGEVDAVLEVKEKVKKALGFSATHRLVRLDWNLSLSPASRGKTVVIDRPKLSGKFGVVEASCGGGHRFVLGEDTTMIEENSGCGKWAYAGTIPAGEYVLRRPFAGKGPAIAVVTKQGDSKLLTGNGPRDGEYLNVETSSTALSPVERKVSIDLKQTVPYKKANSFKTGTHRLSPFALMVFTDSYDDGWRLSGAQGNARPLKVNGFANGYFVGTADVEKTDPGWVKGVLSEAEARLNKDNVVGKNKKDAHVFTLEYKPQRAFRISTAASATALCLVVGLGSRRKKRGGDGNDS